MARALQVILVRQSNEAGWRQFCLHCSLEALPMDRGLDRNRVKQRWGKLTEDDLDIIGQDRAKLVDAIELRYGCSRDAADAQVKNLESRAPAENDGSPESERGSSEHAGTQPPFGQDKVDAPPPRTERRETSKPR
jgi:uncharacterized protein YjbJ (UPF0337 family)